MYSVKSQQDFSVVKFTRREARDVINTMRLVIYNYGFCTVADFYSMVGVVPEFVDHQFGWTDLSSAEIFRSFKRIRSPYYICLPAPTKLK